MMRLLWFLLSFGVLCLPLGTRAAAVLISEFAAASRQALRDEDGDTPDWIELRNFSREPVDLGGWTVALAERSRRPTFWSVPATNLAASECLVIFASGKDRGIAGRPLHSNFKLPDGGGELRLRTPSGEEASRVQYPRQVAGVSYGLAGGADELGGRSILIGPESELRFLIPTNDQLGLKWVSPEFDASGWDRGRNGIGYDARGDHYRDLLQTDVRQAMAGESLGIYLRIPFVATNELRVGSLSFEAQYDDGFVAWLDGVEVARRNAPDRVRWNSAATSTHPDAKARVPERIILDESAGRLVAGTHCLAVHVLNASLTSSDLLFRALLAQPVIEPPGELPDGAPYVYLAAPTPGRPNSSAACSGPHIERLGHQPQDHPRHDQPLLVTAKIIPATTGPVVEARLVYRVMFGSETELEMFDDGQHGDGSAGDGLYGATLPARIAKPGQLLRYYVRAKDESGGISRWPLFADRAGHSACQGTVFEDPAIQSRLPVLHLFIDKAQPANRRRGTTSVTLYYEGELYDNVAMASHGQISRNFPKKSYNLDFPRDHAFRYRAGQSRVHGIKLLANYADKSKIRNTLAYEMIAASGSLSHFAFPVRIQKDGKFFSVAEVVEKGDGRWLERLGRDPQGALYKMYNNLSGAQGAEKKTRKYEDARDLASFAKALSESRPLEERAAYAYEHVDIPQCISYFVAMALISSDDHGHKNYYLYRDTRHSGEWALLPWDVDLSWGRNWTGQYFNETVFADNPLDLYRQGRNKPSNRLYNLFFQDPEFRQMYLRRLRTVMDELLQAPGTAIETLLIEKRVRALVKEVASPQINPCDADLDDAAWPSWGKRSSMREEAQKIMKEHLPARREFLFKSSRARLLGDRIPPSQPKDVILELAPAKTQAGVGEQFVRILNRDKFAVDITNWRLTGAGVDHQFRPGTVIPAGKSLFVVADVRRFRTNPPATAGTGPFFAQGDWIGQLDTQRGPLQLITGSGRKVAQQDPR